MKTPAKRTLSEAMGLDTLDPKDTPLLKGLKQPEDRPIRSIIHGHHASTRAVTPLPIGHMTTTQAKEAKGYVKRRHWERELAEAHATIAMLAQQLADKREIIRRLTT